MDHLHWLQDMGGTFSSISGIACHSQCYSLPSPFGSSYEKTPFLPKKMMALMAALGFVLVQDLVKEWRQGHSPLSMKCQRCLWMVPIKGENSSSPKACNNIRHSHGCFPCFSKECRKTKSSNHLSMTFPQKILANLSPLHF